MLPATKGNLDRRVLSLTKETIPIVSNRRFLEDAAKSIIGQVKVDPVLGFRDSFSDRFEVIRSLEGNCLPDAQTIDEYENLARLLVNRE